MNFISGRDNLAVTVFFPYKCQNDCKFCESKNEYKNGVNVAQIKHRLSEIHDSRIKEVVFTGGEPMENIDLLKELVQIVDNKDVYINTSFTKKNMFEFITYLYDNKSIKGINISRHSVEYEQETLKNIAEDKFIKHIAKPIKINTLLPDNVNEEYIKGIVKRWDFFKNDSHFLLSFRHDFNKMSIEKLHNYNDAILKQMLNVGKLQKRTYCDVCDTTYININGVNCAYHKGLKTTAIQFGDDIQINDIIVFPNGELCYDWDHKRDTGDELIWKYNIRIETASSCGGGC